MMVSVFHIIEQKINALLNPISPMSLRLPNQKYGSNVCKGKDLKKCGASRRKKKPTPIAKFFMLIEPVQY